MTNKESAIFKKVLDTNWEIKIAKEQGEFSKAWEKLDELNTHKKKLKDLMGEVSYNKFMDMGKKMFS